MSSPTYSPPLDAVTTAVLGLLRAGGRVVFDGAYAPDPAMAQQDPRYLADPLKPPYPYEVLYQIPGGDAEPFPDLDGHTRDATVAYQVTSVSNLRNQCQHAARVARDRIVGRSPDGSWAYPLVLPPGWACADRRPDPAMPGVERTGDPPRAIFTSPARYLLTITPTD